LKRPLAYRPETEVQKSITEALALHRVVFTVTDASRSYAKDGSVRQKVRTDWPDVSGVLPGGRAIFIECKTLTGKASLGQLAMLERLKKQGAVAFIARSGFEVHQVLKGLK
jgi:hypothetical protein